MEKNWLKALTITLTLATILMAGCGTNSQQSSRVNNAESKTTQKRVQVGGLTLTVTAIRFHEGYRPKGIKAADIVLRIDGFTKEQLAEEGKVLSITGTSGKVYEMEHMGGISTTESKPNEITLFRDVDETESNMKSVLYQDYKTMSKTKVPVKGITPVVTCK